MCSYQLGEAILLGARSVCARLQKFLSGFSGALREPRPSLDTVWPLSAGPAGRNADLRFSLAPRTTLLSGTRRECLLNCPLRLGKPIELGAAE